MSGAKRLRARNYFHVSLGDKSDPWQFLVQAVLAEGLEGLWFPLAETEGVPFCVPNALISEYNLLVKHYFREVEVQFHSAAGLIFGLILLRPERKLLRERISQFLFNKRTLVRSDRITVLRYVFEQTVKNSSFGISPSGLMTAFYGPRWARHPEYIKVNQYYILVLQSLVSTNDLKLDHGAFQIEPHALATLAQHEEEERRHKDQVRQQRILGFLTAALVVVGLLQVYVTYAGKP